MFLFIYFSYKVQHGTKNIWLKNIVTQNIVPFHLLNTRFALIRHILDEVQAANVSSGKTYTTQNLK